jgi:hypothetical protein
MDDGCEVRFEGLIDIGSSNGSRMKMMLFGVVIKLEICEIELVARMVARNDVGDKSSQSPTLPKAVDE